MRSILRFSCPFFLVLLLCAGCKAEANDTKTASATSGRASSARVSKIVFVGGEGFCQCTLDKINAGWQVMTQALGKSPKLPVERLDFRVHREEVARLRNLKPMMALPAIYFIDSKGAVLELLQGEVTLEQLLAALKRFS